MNAPRPTFSILLATLAVAILASCAGSPGTGPDFDVLRAALRLAADELEAAEVGPSDAPGALRALASAFEDGAGDDVLERARTFLDALLLELEADESLELWAGRLRALLELAATVQSSGPNSRSQD